MAYKTEDLEMQSANKDFVSRETVFNTRENLAEIVSLLVNVDNKAVEDRLLLVLETEQITNFIEIEEIKNEINPVVSCTKTGQQVDYWTDDKISRLLQTVGKKRTIEIIKIKSKNQVANNWLFTDHIALTKLSETDPVGYFVYAISAVLSEMQHYTEALTIKNAWNKEWAKNEFHQLLPIVYNQANKIPLIIIIRINELMRRYLSITQTRAADKHIAFPETRLEYVTSSVSYIEEFEQGLQETIANLIKYEIARGKLKRNLTYADVLNLNLSYKGFSNFRLQKKLKSMTEIEHTMWLLRDFMSDMSPTSIEIKTPEIKKPNTLFIHKGRFNLTINKPKKEPIKLSFATVLRRKD